MAFPPPAQPSTVSLPLPDPAAYPDEPREYARALMQRKDDIEREINTLNDVLASHGADGATSLVDPEGYPRGDIDIYAIRHARSALARLNTDRSTVNTLLARALEAAFSPSSGSSSSSIPNGNASIPRQAQAESRAVPWPTEPVARVNSVASGSPAEASGLRSGDVIYSFVGVTKETGGLQGIGAVVGRSEGTSLKLLVKREGVDTELSLIPRSGWGGRGSLGCHIVPP